MIDLLRTGFLALCLGLLTPAAAGAAPPAYDSTPRIVLFSAYAPEWKALLALVEAPQSRRENGIDFVTGRVEDHDVVLVLSGISMVNAAMTAQMAIDRYALKALLFSGIAGGVDPALHIGDVVVAARWSEYLESIYARETPQGYAMPQWAKPLFPNFGMMFPLGVHVPRADKENNAPDGEPPRRAWIDADASLFALAREAVGQVELKRCDGAACLQTAPRVVVGGNGVSGSAFVDNAAFRAYVYATFSAQVLDMESAAVAHVAATNGVPYLAFRSLSDLAGGGAAANEMEVFETLASENSVAVLRAFLKAMPLN